MGIEKVPLLKIFQIQKHIYRVLTFDWTETLSQTSVRWRPLIARHSPLLFAPYALLQQQKRETQDWILAFPLFFNWLFSLLKASQFKCSYSKSIFITLRVCFPLHLSFICWSRDSPTLQPLLRCGNRCAVPAYWANRPTHSWWYDCSRQAHPLEETPLHHIQTA